MSRKKRQLTPRNPLEDQSEDQPEDQPEKKRRTRGASLLKYITKDIGGGKRIPVEMNLKGQPIGKNKAKLSTFIGTTVKKWIPITVDNWKLVSDEEKNAIWEEVLGGFIIQIDHKKRVLKKANDLWRAFKKDLGRLHMHDKKMGDLVTEPPTMYDSYITQDQWTEFLQIRQSKEFKDKSQKFRNLSLQNDYTYKGSRKGYSGVEEEYKDENKMEPSAIVPRSILWMEARKGSDGEYSEKSKPAIDKINYYTQQEASGELVTSGQKDVLAMALGKPEHPGRVRGVGGDVVISEYFGRKSPLETKGEDKDLVDKLNAKIKDMESNFRAKIEALQLVIQKLMSASQQVCEENQLPEVHAVHTPQPCPLSGKASCSALNTTSSKSKAEGWQSCKLFLSNPKQEVADGKVYCPSSVEVVQLHNRPLESGYVKVQVVKPIMGDKQVPCPTVEAHTVKEAVGQFIAWPENLVVICTDVLKCARFESSKEQVKGKTLTNESVIGPSEVDSEASHLDSYNWVFEEFKDNWLRHFKISTDIFKYNHLGVEFCKDDMDIWFNRKELEASHMILYISFLFDTYCKGVEGKFKFLCPIQISPLTQNIHERATYIANAMEGDVNDTIFFAPYHFEFHWVLILMIRKLGAAFWIDPLHGKVKPDAMELVHLSYKMKYYKLGRKTPRKDTLWRLVQCPRQLNTVDCGYYVLKFMRDILHRGSCVITSKWIDDKSTYKNEDLDEIRREWLDYLFTLLM